MVSLSRASWRFGRLLIARAILRGPCWRATFDAQTGAVTVEGEGEFDSVTAAIRSRGGGAVRRFAFWGVERDRRVIELAKLREVLLQRVGGSAAGTSVGVTRLRAGRSVGVMTLHSSSAADPAADAGPPSRHLASLRRRLLCRAGAAAVVPGLIAGCGGSAKNATSAPPACGPGKGAPTLRLVLSNHAPTPRVPAAQGATVEVISSFERQQMTFPVAHPSTAVCELSRHRGSSGVATVVYRVVRPRTITFSSTYTHATMAMMPEMLGWLSVSRGGQPATVATVTRPARPVWCPTVFHAQTAGLSKPNHRVTGSFDTRTLLGRGAPDAAVIARQHGCSWRVVNQGAVLTADGRPDRVDADVINGRVTAVGVY